MAENHARGQKNLNVEGMGPAFETRALPRQPFFNVNLDNGGRPSFPKAVGDKLPPGKSLKWNGALSTEFMSTKLTKRDKMGNWKFNRSWNGRFPGVFRDNQVEVKDRSLVMKATRKPGPMPWFLKSRFSPHDRNGIHKDKDLPHYFETSFLRTKRTMTYGYTEICCRLSSSTATSSFWLKEVGNSNREIDVFEYTTGRQFGGSRPTLEHIHMMSIHQFRSRVTGKHERIHSQIKFDRDLSSENFFIAGVLWTDTKLYFFVNDECVRELDHRGLFGSDCKMHVQVDREVFDWIDLPAQNDALDDFEVFYVRTWDL